MRGTDGKLGDIPPSTTVTITCSPKFGLWRTLEYSALAVQAGHRGQIQPKASYIRDLLSDILTARRRHRPRIPARFQKRLESLAAQPFCAPGSPQQLRPRAGSVLARLSDAGGPGGLSKDLVRHN
jgi:hypothetical protein